MIGGTRVGCDVKILVQKKLLKGSRNYIYNMSTLSLAMTRVLGMYIYETLTYTKVPLMI